MTPRFLSPAQAELLREWWYALQPHGEGERKPAAEFAMFTRKDRAELRRCVSPVQVLMQPAAIRLIKRLAGLEAGRAFSPFEFVDEDGTASTPESGKHIDPTPYALIAGLVAHIETDLNDQSSFATLLGTHAEADRPRMSELRFARLQTAADEDEFFLCARRALPLIGCRADVARLADDLLAWVWEARGNVPDKPRDRLRVRWATDYFTAHNELDASPSADRTTPIGEPE